MKKILFGFIIFAFAISSCNDDYFNPDVDDNHMDKIGYAINIANESDEFQSRGNTTKTNKHVTVEKLDATIGGKTLYLHTDVSNTIPESASVTTNETLSRGSISKSVDEINVSAVVINGSNGAKGWPASGESQMYMNNERVSEEYNWITGRYWPQEQDSIRFYAYAPIDALASTSVDGADGLPGIYNGEPSFYYKVNDDIEKQQDLLVAVAQYKGNHCKPAQINMCHALTAVEIHLSKDVNDFKLKKLTISGIENEGIYDYGFTPILGNKEESARESGSWQLHDTDSQLAQYTLYSNDDGMELSGSQVNMSENANGDTTLLLMMIPQVLTDEATIIVEGVDGIMNKDVKLTAKIGGDGKAWHKGEHVVYTLTFSSTKIDYYIDVVANNSQNIPYYGIKDQEYTVKSYKVISRSGLDPLTIAVPWEVVAIENESEVDIPAGLMLSALSGDGVPNLSSVESYTFCMLPNLDISTSRSHMNFLTPNVTSIDPFKGSESVPYDLSTEKDYSPNQYPQNTANSYMIFAPGYYTFPLVYGNAITSGSTNVSAYTGYSGSYNQSLSKTDYSGNTTGVTINVPCKGLGNFVDHANNAIIGPWIVSSNSRGGRYVPATAEIVWQDEPCLVTEVKLNSTKDYVQFRVNEETVCDGNAVIAVKNSEGTIMWSWHIWVNDGHAYHNQSNEVGGEDLFSQRYIAENDKTFSTIQLTNRRVVSADWKDCSWGQYNATGTYIGMNFHVSRVFLGHCDGENKHYLPRNVKIRFKQVEDENSEFIGVPTSCEVVFTQNEGTTQSVNNIPYYQYGRKDPMLPTGQKNTDKIYYDNDWQPHNNIVKGNKQATLSEAIKAPGTFFSQQSRSIINDLRNYNWCSEGTYLNLWNSNSWSVPSFAYHSNFGDGNRYKFHAWFNELITSGMTKTVYDPCPPGYEMPRIDAFTGASFHGMNVYPLWYDGQTDPTKFAFYTNGGYNDMYGAFGYHVHGNVWLNPWGNPYYTCATNFNSISIYATPMTIAGERGSGPANGGGETLPIPFFGHRNEAGNVAQYGQYASALTSAPMCTQNMVSSGSTMESNAQYMLVRLCIIKSKDLHHGTSITIPYSLRVFSGSDFDLAFGIIPAVSGSNPYTTTTSVNNGGIQWTDGNKSDHTVEF